MELSSTRLYDLWSGLDDLLQTGVPAAVEEHDVNEFFDVLYRDPVALRRLLSGMTGISTGEVTLLAARFPWKRFATFADVGCAQGALPVRVALTHPHLHGTGFDLPVVERLNIMLETRDGYESTTSDCAELLRFSGTSSARRRWRTASNADLATHRMDILHTRGRLLPT
jgi:hypothetical protein